MLFSQYNGSKEYNFGAQPHNTYAIPNIWTCINNLNMIIVHIGQYILPITYDMISLLKLHKCWDFYYLFKNKITFDITTI